GHCTKCDGSAFRYLVEERERPGTADYFEEPMRMHPGQPMLSNFRGDSWTLFYRAHAAVSILCSSNKRFIVWINRSGSKGFDRYSSKPEISAVSRSAGVENAVRAITGVRCDSDLLRRMAAINA